MVERANRCYRWHDMVACTSVRGERRGCKKYVARINSCKFGKQERAKKVVKKWPGLTPNWRRPRRQDTKMRSLWPDLEMVARREGHGVERLRDEVWRELGDFAAKTSAFRV